MSLLLIHLPCEQEELGLALRILFLHGAVLPWLLTAATGLRLVPYRALKGVNIMLDCCLDVYKFGILIYEIGSTQI